MAFVNLFTGLFAVNEDVKSLKEPAVSHRNNSEHGRKHRTRKNQGCQGGPVNKRPRSQNQRNRRNFDVTKEDNGNLSIESPIETSELGGSGLMAERTHCHDDRPKLSVVYNCRKNKDKRYRNNNNRYQQRKQLESRVQQRDEENRCRGGSSRGRGDGRHKHVKLVKGPKPMSEEFKEQNALMVDGQLVCRHFLYGRCIKGDECQLKHIQGYNDCIKKVCKFYVQGFCTKGAGCPYMHKSFPCKFFHRKGTCLNGELCMFSHEPLNETTAMLLEEALKRDNDLYELATKAEQKSPMQQASTDEPGSTDAMETADVDLATLRLQFYHSRETNPEQEAVCSETEIEEVSDSTLPTEGFELYNPPSVTSSYLQPEEPVCYSVEAVLGPRLYRPFPRFSPTPVSQDLSSQSSSQKPSDLGCQSQAPCSVDTILSCKSGRKVLSRTSSPTTAQSLSLFGDCKKLTEPLPGSETKSSMSGKKDMTEPQEEMSDISTMPPEDTQTCKEEVGAGPGHFLLSAPAPESESFRREVNLQDSGHPGHVLPSVSCGSAGAVAFSPMDCKRQTSAHSSRSRLHSPGPVLDSEGSGLSKITCRPAQPVEESSRAQRLFEKPQSDLKPGKQLHESTLAPSESNSETVNSGAGTREKQFSSLFSNPITGDHRSDTDVSQAHSPASHCRSKGTASDGTSTRPFLCLFTSLKDTSETPIQTEQSSTAFKLFDTSTSSSPCGGADHSRTHTRISPTVSSPKGATTAAVTTSPDLKTLFLSLSPYKADEEWKDGVSADTIEVRGSFQRLFTQHQTKKKKRKKKRPRTKCDQRKRTSSHLDHGASRHISPHVTEETTLSSLEQTRPQETKA